MAYADEIAAANRLKSREERFAARNAVRAKYGMEAEKRTRGGLAGVYDRNKEVVQAAIPTLAGMLIPGGAIAGAVAGGLARGLDRPGKAGIGLDVGQAARGALTGAALGSAGKFLGGKMGVGVGAPPATTGLKAMPEAGKAVTTVGGAPALPRGAMAPAPAPAPAPVAAPVAAAAPTAASVAPKAAASGFERFLTGAKEYAPLIQATATPVAAVLGGSMEQDIEARKLQLQEDQIRREQEARDRLAQLLMPMFQQQATQMRGR